MSQPALPSGVSLTAITIARERSVETHRTDRLFRDDLAGAFCTAARKAIGPKSFPGFDSTLSEAMPLFRGYIALRTRFLDDQLLAACAAGCKQVVILAAGLDARAYRLPWPEGVRLFELDMPEVLAFKKRVVDDQGAEARCQRVEVPLDLRDDWTQPLQRAGFQPDVPTAWLAEGLLVYLTNEDNERLLRRVGMLSAPGSQFALEHADSRVLKQAAVTEVETTTLAKEGISFKSGVDDPITWLKGHGWRGSTLDMDAYARSFGRTVPPVFARASATGRLWLIRATRP